MHLDLVRREQLLIKFHLQLCTYPSDRLEKLEAPYNEEKADKFLEGLEESDDIPFIVTDATRSGNPIVQINAAFSMLTGYARHDVLGKNPRILQGKDTDRNKVTEIAQFVAQKQEDSHFLIKNYKKNGEMFWNLLYLAPILEEKFEHTVPGAPPTSSFEVMRWVGVLCDVTPLVGMYQRKPCVQGVINVSKFLLNQLKGTLTILAPIFGSPEWGKEKPDLNKLRGDAYNTNALHPDDEFLGELGVTQSFGDIAFRANTEDATPKNPATIIAGPEGAQVIVLSRQMWMGAHAMEPVRFLRSMQMFSEVDNNKLQRLAVYMTQIPCSYRQVVARAGQPATNVYLVRSGQLSVQIHIDEQGEPLPLRKIIKGHKEPSNTQQQQHQQQQQGGEGEGGEMAEEDDGSEEKGGKRRRTMKEVALIGIHDAFDEGVAVGMESFYPADLVANTEDVVLYELPKKNLEKVMGADFKVHPKAVIRDRREQRSEYVGNVTRSTKEAMRLMEVPKSEQNFGAWLGWTGYRGLPKLYSKTTPSPFLSAPQKRTVSPPARFEVLQHLVSPRAPFLPDIGDAKKRHHAELLEKAEEHIDEISLLGKKGAQARVEAVEFVLDAERKRFNINNREDMELQERVRRMVPDKYSRSASAMGKLSPSKSPAKASPGKPRRSSSSMLTHPLSGAEKRTMGVWPCRDGAKQIVRLGSLGRRLAGAEKKAYERRLRQFVPPGGGTAAAARGLAYH